MDFELNETQRAMRDAAQEFAREALAPNAAHWDAEEIFPRDVLTQAGELGFCGLYSPEAQGGLGLARLDSAMIFEALAGGCTSTAAYLSIHNMATWMIATFGGDDVRDAWCESLTSGASLASYCLTEPGAGSDAGSLSTRADRDGNDYVINGGKCFISGAGDTEMLVVMARTGEPGPRGISTFAVPADSAGISYGRKEPKMGWNSQATRSITFEDVRVSAANRLGEEGQGFAIAMKGLDGGRINIAACSLGTAQAALDASRNYVQERSQFGRRLAEFQMTEFKLADMATELMAARQMTWLAASRLDDGHREATATCAMAKRLATDRCFDICNQALQIHGGYGYIREYPLERYVRDVRVHQILEGTNEIMRSIIARRVLADHDGEALR